MIDLVLHLPRTGSTACMLVLQAGGIPIVHHASRDAHVHELFEDEYFTLQPGGGSVLEFEQTRLDELEPGKAHKIWLLAHKNLPVREAAWHDCQQGYRILIPLRDAAAVDESYRRAATRPPPPDISAEAEATWLTSLQLERDRVKRALRDVPNTISQLRNRRDVALCHSISYESLRRNPLAACEQLQRAGWPIDPVAAATAITPAAASAVA